MDINVDDLDYSAYMLPYEMAEGKFKDVLKTNYTSAINMSEFDIIENIVLLKSFLAYNLCLEDFQNEFWMVGNMESNFRYALATIRGELEDK